MNEAIEQINAEIRRLNNQVSTLEKARDLLAGLARPVYVQPTQKANQPPTRTQSGGNTVAAATRYAISQISGQFLTGDIARKVHQQGYDGRKVGVAVTAELKELRKKGYITCITKRHGQGGNTWIKTAELDAATNPTLTEKTL